MKAGLLTSLAILATAASAAGQSSSVTRADAEGHYMNERWFEAERAWQWIVSRSPEDTHAWLRLGATLHRLDQDEIALAALEKAQLADGSLTPEAMFWKAAALMSSNQESAAFDSLEAAAERGWWDEELAKSVRDLLPLRRQRRVKILATTALEQSSKAIAEFDSFLGEWSLIAEIPQDDGSWLESNRGRRTIRRHENGVSVIDELSSGGTGLYSWHPTTCTWRLFRQTPEENPGKVTILQGRFENGSGSFDGGAVKPGTETGIVKRIVMICASDSVFVEELYRIEEGAYQLQERRHHVRIE